MANLPSPTFPSLRLPKIFCNPLLPRLWPYELSLSFTSFLFPLHCSSLLTPPYFSFPFTTFSCPLSLFVPFPNSPSLCSLLSPLINQHAIPFSLLIPIFSSFLPCSHIPLLCQFFCLLFYSSCLLVTVYVSPIILFFVLASRLLIFSYPFLLTYISHTHQFIRCKELPRCVIFIKGSFPEMTTRTQPAAKRN